MKTRFVLLLLCMVLTAMQAFAQPRSISNVRVDPQTTVQNETAISIHPLDDNKLIVDWNDFGSELYAKQKFAYSYLASTTWLVRNAMSYFVAGYTDYIYTFDPSIAYDRNGNVFATYISATYQGMLNKTLGFTTVAKSTNNGYSWVPVKVSTEITYQDKPWITVDNTTGTYSGRVYTSWSNFYNDGSKINFAYSADQGQTFSTPIIIESATATVYPDAYSTEATSATPSTNYVQASTPVVGPNGDVYLVWAYIVDKGATDGVNLKFAKSIDGGSSFSAPQSLALFTYPKQESGGWKIPGFPSITIDPSTGIINIVYVDRVGATNTKIKYLYSTDGGQNFSSPAIIGDLGNGRYLLPYIANDKNGILSVAYIYFSNPNAIDVYLTENHLGYWGPNFSTPVKITSQPSSLTTDYFPDYIGIASSTDGHRYISWSDNRSHATNTYVGDVNFGPLPPANVAVTSIGRFPPKAKITWSANTETEMQETGAFYEIYRGTSETNVAFLTTVPYTSTSYTDNEVSVGSGGLTIYYRVRAKGSNNYRSPLSNSVAIGSSNWQAKRYIANNQNKPTEFLMENNYPNPFNPTTNIAYQIPNDEFVTISVFDILGREIKTLVNEFKTTGYYSVEFDASKLSSGLYFYSIKAGNYKAVKKMSLIK